jgi:hypothetical protein
MLQQLSFASAMTPAFEDQEHKYMSSQGGSANPLATTLPRAMPQFLNMNHAPNSAMAMCQANSLHAFNLSSMLLPPRFPFPVAPQLHQLQGQLDYPRPSFSCLPSFPFPTHGMNATISPIPGSSQLHAAQAQTSTSASSRLATSLSSTAGIYAPPSRKRTVSTDDDTESASSNGTPKPKRAIKRARLEVGEEHSDMGLGGESRLKINFLGLGNPGRHPQIFGKSRLGVPDGLSGTYVLYSERWRSEIIHGEGSHRAEDGTHHVLITWKITNLTSGVTQSRTETLREAILRHKDGRTLCNKVFRKALEHRAQELEEEVKRETNPIRIKTMKNLIKKLRPKHFSEGPLVFGLRHETVQNRFKSMTTLDNEGFLVAKLGLA